MPGSRPVIWLMALKRWVKDGGPGRKGGPRFGEGCVGMTEADQYTGLYQIMDLG